MRPEIHAKLNNLAFEASELCKEFRIDPEQDAQFAAKLLSQGMAGLSMMLQNQYGVKLCPIANVATPAPEPEPVAEVATPKPKKVKK